MGFGMQTVCGSGELPPLLLWAQPCCARRTKQAEAHSSGLDRRLREHEARAADLERAAKEGEIRAADAEGRGKLAEVGEGRGRKRLRLGRGRRDVDPQIEVGWEFRAGNHMGVTGSN